MSESSNVQPLPEDAASAPVQDAAERTSHSAAEQKPGSGLAIASLVSGILGILTGIFIYGVALGLAGIVLGIVALVQVRRGAASGKGLAIGGIVTGVVSFVVAAVTIAVIVLNAMMGQECINNGHETSDGGYVCTLGGHEQTLSPSEYKNLSRF